MNYKNKFDTMKNKSMEKLEEVKSYDYKAKIDEIKQTGQEGMQKLNKKKVKWIAISVVAVVLILFVAVGISKVVGKLSLSPESAVQNMFHTYQSVETIAEEMGTQPTEETKILQPILDNLKYKIISTRNKTSVFHKKQNYF